MGSNWLTALGYLSIEILERGLSSWSKSGSKKYRLVLVEPEKSETAMLTLYNKLKKKLADRKIPFVSVNSRIHVLDKVIEDNTPPGQVALLIVGQSGWQSLDMQAGTAHVMLSPQVLSQLLEEPRVMHTWNVSSVYTLFLNNMRVYIASSGDELARLEQFVLTANGNVTEDIEQAEIVLLGSSGGHAKIQTAVVRKLIALRAASPNIFKGFRWLSMTELPRFLLGPTTTNELTMSLGTIYKDVESFPAAPLEPLMLLLVGFSGVGLDRLKACIEELGGETKTSIEEGCVVIVNTKNSSSELIEGLSNQQRVQYRSYSLYVLRRDWLDNVLAGSKFVDPGQELYRMEPIVLRNFARQTTLCGFKFYINLVAKADKKLVSMFVEDEGALLTEHKEQADVVVLSQHFFVASDWELADSRCCTVACIEQLNEDRHYHSPCPPHHGPIALPNELRSRFNGKVVYSVVKRELEGVADQLAKAMGSTGCKKTLTVNEKNIQKSLYLWDGQCSRAKMEALALAKPEAVLNLVELLGESCSEPSQPVDEFPEIVSAPPPVIRLAQSRVCSSSIITHSCPELVNKRINGYLTENLLAWKRNCFSEQQILLDFDSGNPIVVDEIGVEVKLNDGMGIMWTFVEGYMFQQSQPMLVALYKCSGGLAEKKKIASELAGLLVDALDRICLGKVKKVNVELGSIELQSVWGGQRILWASLNWAKGKLVRLFVHVSVLWALEKFPCLPSRLSNLMFNIDCGTDNCGHAICNRHAQDIVDGGHLVTRCRGNPFGAPIQLEVNVQERITKILFVNLGWSSASCTLDPAELLRMTDHFDKKLSVKTKDLRLEPSLYCWTSSGQ